MKFSRLFLSISFLICGFAISSQYVIAAVIPGPGIEIKNQTQFTSLSFEDKVYKPGDTVKVSFAFTNNDSFDYSDVSLSSYLEVFSSTTKSFDVYGMQNKIGKYFIPRLSSKVISFEYTIPQSGNITKNSVARLAANVFKGTGVSLGSVSGRIKVEELMASIDVLSVYIKTGNDTYGIQEGPVISATTSARLIAKLQNKTGGVISLIPKITVFDLQPSRPEVENKTYNILNLKKDESYDLDIELPKISKPGVYAGELSLFDEKGVGRSTLITSRWIVDGDMVTIPSVTIDKTSIKKGETANINVVYTGAPINIDTKNIHNVGKGELKVTLFGNKNHIIAEDQKELDFNTLSSNVVFNLAAKEASSKLSVLVIASKDGKELARYNTLLTDPDAPVVKEFSMKNIVIFSLFSLAVLLLVVVFFLKRSRKVLPTLLFLIIFSTVVFSLDGNKALAADRACLNNQFCAQGSLTSDLVVSPNINISSEIWNVAEAQVCANGGGATTVEYKIYDSNNKLISQKTAYESDGVAMTHDQYKYYVWAAGQWYKLAMSELEQENMTNYSNDMDIYDSYIALINSANGWRVFSGFNPNTANSGAVNIISPSTPGVYKLVTSVSLFANYRDAWRSVGDETNGGPKPQGPISFEYNFTVACPSGQVWNGSSCGVSTLPRPGSCGVNAGSCNVGTSSDISTTGTQNTWFCSGLNGGATSSICSACLSGFVLNANQQCVPETSNPSCDPGVRNCQGGNLVNGCGNVVASTTAGQSCVSLGGGNSSIVDNTSLMASSTFVSYRPYVSKNSICTLKYNIMGASRCKITGKNLILGDVLDLSSQLVNGVLSSSTNTMPLASSTTYTLSCDYNNGSGTSTVLRQAICRVLGVIEF